MTPLLPDRGRPEEIGVNRRGDERVGLVGRAAATQRPLPQVAPQGVDGVSIAPDGGVVVGVVQPDEAEVVAAEADTQPTAESPLDMGAADSQRAELEVNNVGRQSNERCVQIELPRRPRGPNYTEWPGPAPLSSCWPLPGGDRRQGSPTM